MLFKTMMFIVSESEFCAPSFIIKITGIVVGASEYGGVPEKLLPVYVSHEGIPIIVIVIAYPSGSFVEGVKLRSAPTLIV